MNISTYMIMYTCVAIAAKIQYALDTVGTSA